MTTNTQDKEEQRIHTLSDLVGFDLPALCSHFQSNEVTYTLDGDDKELDDLKSAASNAEILMHSGIEAITGLLLTTDLYCPDEIHRRDRISALALVSELSRVLQKIHELSWQLDRATAEQQTSATVGEPA